MPAPGVKPTEGPKRFRGQARTEWTDVEDVPFEGASPDLPDHLSWPAQTKSWWEVVRHLPHAVLWDLGEWEEALTTALLHASVWREPEAPATNRLNELRQRERLLGLTADARRDLRIRYVAPKRTEPEAPVPGNVVVLNPNLRPRRDALET